MERINYHHLLYFWTVAREGGLVPAAEVLHLTPSTLSGQIRLLERRVGSKLFLREGRRLVITERGRLVQRYADEIFTLGRELEQAIEGRAFGRPARLEVGASDALPKLLVRRLVEPALRLDTPVRLVCREGPLDRLLAELTVHRHDVVLSDTPPPPGSAVRAHHHLLSECGVSIVGVRKLAAPRRRGFPASLDGAPFLLPLEGMTLRRALDRWFESGPFRPQVVAEFEDTALLKEFGAEGRGLFAVPTVIEADVVRQFRVVVAGRTDAVRERFYAITTNRHTRNPAVAAICAPVTRSTP